MHTYHAYTIHIYTHGCDIYMDKYIHTPIHPCAYTYISIHPCTCILKSHVHRSRRTVGDANAKALQLRKCQACTYIPRGCAGAYSLLDITFAVSWIPSPAAAARRARKQVRRHRHCETRQTANRPLPPPGDTAAFMSRLPRGYQLVQQLLYDTFMLGYFRLD